MRGVTFAFDTPRAPILSTTTPTMVSFFIMCIITLGQIGPMSELNRYDGDRTHGDDYSNALRETIEIADALTIQMQRDEEALTNLNSQASSVMDTLVVAQESTWCMRWTSYRWWRWIMEWTGVEYVSDQLTRWIMPACPPEHQPPHSPPFGITSVGTTEAAASHHRDAQIARDVALLKHRAHEIGESLDRQLTMLDRTASVTGVAEDRARRVNRVLSDLPQTTI